MRMETGQVSPRTATGVNVAPWSGARDAPNYIADITRRPGAPTPSPVPCSFARSHSATAPARRPSRPAAPPAESPRRPSRGCADVRAIVVSRVYADPSTRGKLKALAGLGVSVAAAVPDRWTPVGLGAEQQTSYGDDAGVRTVPIPVRGS